MISLVCCYNDLQQYKNMQKSLEKQNVEYELIGIDNRDGKYKSAASALNVGGAEPMVKFWYFYIKTLFLKKKIV